MRLKFTVVLFVICKMAFKRLRWFFLAYWIAAVYVVREWIYRKFNRGHGLRDKELCQQKGRFAIVTGGSRGIGLEIVQQLLELGGRVIIGSSSSAESRNKLEMSLKNKYPLAEVEVWHLDLASLQSVYEFTQKFFTIGRQLDLLINNAGIMFVSPREETKDGFEHHFSVNYLSHCLLSLLLLPALIQKEASKHKARIVNSTSCIHYVSDLDLNDLQEKNSYSKYHAYMQSKLAQIMFTYSLQEYFDKKKVNITVNCAHPGVTNTDLMNNVWWTSYVASKCFKTARQGAETVIYAATALEMEDVKGKYLEECSIVKSSRISRDPELQKALWDHTLSLLKSWLPTDLYEDLLSHDTSNN